MSELHEALLKVQAALKPLPRKRKGQAGTRQTTYADLADFETAVFPLLETAGLVWMTKPTTRDDGRFVLYYAMIHAATGEREEGDYPLHDGTGQQKGSEITYARRQCLGAVTGAVAVGEDDDAFHASGGQGRQRQARPPQRPSAPVTRTRTTGPDHERLRHGTVEATPGDRAAQRTRGPIPDDDNTWQAPMTAPSGNGRASMIVQHFKRLGVTDDGVRLGYTAALTNRVAVSSTNDLTPDEQRELLDKLSHCKNADALDQLMKAAGEAVTT